MPTIHEKLCSIRRRLEAVSSEAAQEAQLILAHVYGTTPGALIMRLLHEAEREEETDRIVAARLEGRPLAYILKSRSFYGADFYVDERVLIPRWDTESVVKEAVRRIAACEYRTAADICCGSGCIGITLLRETDIGCVTFTDISPGALAVACENARRLAPQRAARFCRGDLLRAMTEPADLLVCNPPYIPDAEIATLESQVRDHEPRLALAGGWDGLGFYRRLAEDAPEFLRPGGTLLMETGDGQAQAVSGLLAEHGFADIQTGEDLSGRLRWAAGVWR
ncbi:MAG: peptide chain release factor N(5)-glutamine methyltransferase [Clostridia bacterium]|nr:peptide chain release factor N(5)-glutamine methyltransferase [Clostridia bacterium]